MPDGGPGNVKVTREDWVRVAMDALVSDGADSVKVLALAERLAVSRSSFYWYFRSRQDLLDALLDQWGETNTAAMVAQAEAPAATVTAAVLNVFRCVTDPRLFDFPLDFAVRDWARRSGKVRRALDRSDAERLAALRAMFARHGYAEREAEVRARVLYWMQIGYSGAELAEPWQDRLALVPDYLLVFTGRAADPEEIAAYTAYSTAVQEELRHG